MAQLRETETTATQTTVLKWDGGQAVLAAVGTFDTATAKFEMSPDEGTTWIDISGASFTADGFARETFPGGIELRGDLSSVGASSSVTFIIRGT